MRLGIIGGGRAAWAFGSSWLRIGWPIAGVWLREESHSRIAELLKTKRTDVETLAGDAELLLIAVSVGECDMCPWCNGIGIGQTVRAWDSSIATAKS